MVVLMVPEIHTIPAEINSNDFGLFSNQLVDFESNFVVAGINNFARIEFLVCLGFLCCVLWLVFTRGQTTQHGHSDPCCAVRFDSVKLVL